MITAAASTAGAAARVGGGATSAAAATANAVMATPGPGTSARSAGEHAGEASRGGCTVTRIGPKRDRAVTPGSSFPRSLGFSIARIIVIRAKQDGDSDERDIRG